jgi:hypothetical protein
MEKRSRSVETFLDQIVENMMSDENFLSQQGQVMDAFRSLVTDGSLDQIILARIVLTPATRIPLIPKAVEPNGC